MKPAKILVAVFSFFLISSLFAASNPQDVEAIKEVIKSYVTSVDMRNADNLEKVLYSEGNYVNYNKISNQTLQMSNDEFIDMVKKGRAGGWTRELNVNNVDVNSNTAIAKVEIVDSKVKQSGYLTLVKDKDTWKIVTSAYTLESVQ